MTKAAHRIRRAKRAIAKATRKRTAFMTDETFRELIVSMKQALVHAQANRSK
jgi:cellobiose-specific phosphotransferase system component IIA